MQVYKKSVFIQWLRWHGQLYYTNGRLSNIRLWKVIIIKTGRFLPFAIQWREIGNYKLRTPCNLNTFGWTGFSITWNIYLSSKFLFITFSCFFFELLKLDFNFRSKVHLFSIEDSMLIVRVFFLPTRRKRDSNSSHLFCFSFLHFLFESKRYQEIFNGDSSMGSPSARKYID